MDKEKRIVELEKKAINNYIKNSEWGDVYICLSDEDQKEYKKLIKEVYDLDY